MKHFTVLILLIFVLAGCSSRNFTNTQRSQPIDDNRKLWEASDEQKESEKIPTSNNQIDKKILDTIREIKQKYPFFDLDW